jgi:hypothetical protein
LIDLPSVDKEKMKKIVAHKAFWNVTDVNNLNADVEYWHYGNDLCG